MTANTSGKATALQAVPHAPARVIRTKSEAPSPSLAFAVDPGWYETYWYSATQDTRLARVTAFVLRSLGAVARAFSNPANTLGSPSGQGTVTCPSPRKVSGQTRNGTTATRLGTAGN